MSPEKTPPPPPDPNPSDPKKKEDSTFDPVEARTQHVGELKRADVSPDASTTVRAKTDTGHLAVPGTETVRLKVVREKKRGTGSTISLRPSARQQAAQAGKQDANDASPATGGKTLKVSPVGRAESQPPVPGMGSMDTTTATLKVAKRPEHQATSAREGEKPAHSTTGPVPLRGSQSKTSTSTMRVSAKQKQESAPTTSEAITQEATARVGTVPTGAPLQRQAQKTSTSTMKVTRRVRPEEPAKPAAEKPPEATQATAAPPPIASTRTAPLKKKKIKPKSNETLRIKPPTLLESQSPDTAAAAAPTANVTMRPDAPPAAPPSTAGKGKQTGKLTLKMKGRPSRTVSLADVESQGTEDADATVDVAEAASKETVSISPGAKKTLKLKAGDRPTTAAAVLREGGTDKTAAAEAAEPGVMITIAATASLVAAGVVAFFAVSQYVNLLG